MTDICRLCASLKRLDHLQTLTNPALEATEKLARCCQMVFPPANDEYLPQNVCFDCVVHLNASFAFAERVEQAQETLRQAFLVDMKLEQMEHQQQPPQEDVGTAATTESMDIVTDANTTVASVAVCTEPIFKVRSVIISLHLKGYSVLDICKRLQLDEQVVSDWIMTYRTYSDHCEVNDDGDDGVNESATATFSHKEQLMTEAPSSDDHNEYTDFNESNVIELLNATDKETNSSVHQHNECEQIVQLDVKVENAELTRDAEQPINFPHLLSTNERNIDGTITANGVVRLRNHYLPKSVPTWHSYPWTCGGCSERFDSATDLRSHCLAAHPSARVGRYACRDCRKTFVKYRAFVEHVGLRHEPLLQFCCDICSLWFWDTRLMRQHRSTHIREQQPLLELPNASDDLQPDAQMCNNHCEKCENSFPDVSTLASHNCIPLEAIKMMCAVCHGTFADTEQMLLHRCPDRQDATNGGVPVADNHPKTSPVVANDCRPYKCELCSKTFKTHIRMIRHRTVHTGHKPYMCEQCGREFRERSTLREHVRIHTGAMPFACDFCGKRFRFKGVLTTHRRQHTGERPYSCIECNHHFTNWPNYNKHMKRKHGINTSVNVRKPQDIPPSGMPAKAKLNHIVPTVNNVHLQPDCRTSNLTIVSVHSAVQ